MVSISTRKHIVHNAPTKDGSALKVEFHVSASTTVAAALSTVGHAIRAAGVRASAPQMTVQEIVAGQTTAGAATTRVATIPGTSTTQVQNLFK